MPIVDWADPRDVEYADATEAYAGSLFASQFNALTPLYMQALKAKSVTELNNKLDALRAQLRQCALTRKKVRL